MYKKQYRMLVFKIGYGLGISVIRNVKKRLYDPPYQFFSLLLTKTTRTTSGEIRDFDMNDCLSLVKPMNDKK